MTDVINSKNSKITASQDALHLYAPPPADMSGKIGIEIEMPLYTAGTVKPTIPTAPEMLAMQSFLKQKGYDAQLEAAGVLEYASPAVPVTDIRALLRVVEKDVAVFEQEAQVHGYQRAPFSILPTTTQQDAMDNLVSRERLVASITAMRDIFDPVMLNLPLLTTGVQTSFSPSNEDEMFRMMYRGYALTPLLIAAMNSSAGFVANDPVRQDVHLRGSYYDACGSAGGIANSFLKAASGASLITNHIDAVFDTPMHFAYDADGGLMRSTADNVITFRKLIDKGLNTISNYELAESFIYNDVKICNLRDAEGNVAGKRLEIRAADSGLHQAASTLLLTGALIPDGKTADAFEALLKDYGFTGKPQQDAALLTDARQAAVHHQGKFMDIGFGTGRLRDFAADVAGVLVTHYQGAGVQPELSHLVNILLTGECDAKVFARTLPTLKDVTASLNAMEPKMAGVPPTLKTIKRSV